MKRIWIRTALINFILAALIGASLRYAFVEELGWMGYTNYLHAHSHVAMLGWVYLALFAGLTAAFLPRVRWDGPFYNRLFWLTQLAVLGMLFSFPVGGYMPVSIAFSTLHVVLAGVFIYRFSKDLRQAAPSGLFSHRLVRAALLFQALSFVGILSIGPIIALGAKGTIWYYMAVQFFLHFQFNGWFLFAVLALFFRVLEQNKVLLPQDLLRPFFWLLVAATFLTYALAVAWASPQDPVFWVNSLGVALQLAAVIYLVAIFRRIEPQARPLFSGWGKTLFGIALACFLAKILMQTAVIIPYIATVAYTVRNFVIGFIHLMLLGVISSFLIGYSLFRGGLRIDKGIAKAGLVLFLAGFAGSELILFLQGTMFWGAKGFIPYYYQLLFGVTALMPGGLVLFLAGQYGKTAKSGFNKTGQAPSS